MEGEIKAHLQSSFWLSLMNVIRAELFWGFKRVTQMWDIKKNEELFIHLYGELVLLLLWVSYLTFHKQKRVIVWIFLKIDLLFNVKELRDGSFHLWIS